MIKALITIVVIVVAGIVIGTSASSFVNRDNDKQVLSTQSEQSEQQQKEVDPLPGVPVKVTIPSINVDTVIESVGMDSQRRMDVPKDSNNTAWFNPGYRPGQPGNAVLAGHYDNVDGSPSVFWEIKELKLGDKITITDDKGEEKTFAVTRIEQYPHDEFPIQEVFGESSEAMLNLITCQGNWDEKTKNYSDRMVVYSKLVTE